MAVDYRSTQYPTQSAASGDGAHPEAFDRIGSDLPEPDLFADTREAIEAEDQQTDLEELIRIRSAAEDEMPGVIRAFARILSHLQREAKLDPHTRANLHFAASREVPNILSLACRISAAPRAAMDDVLADHRRTRLLLGADRHSAQLAPRVR